MRLAWHVIGGGRNCEQEGASRAGRRCKEHSSLWVNKLLWVCTESQGDRAHLHMRVRVRNVGPEHQGEGCAKGAGEIGRKVVHNVVYMRYRGGVLSRGTSKVAISKGVLPD